ncbi:MAG: putative ATP-dependent RNA helicase DHX35-like [Trebouxia sp. A1-2]|nr:MAG: putative ATP-dependent RNA helicase DHX35-like [Trebouxia sp. A1-2]
MSGFLRPGQKRSAAFGISFESDRDQAANAANVYNSREHLAVQDQRSRLPVFKHRKELLYLVETHATSLVVGETGSGKTTQIPQYLDEAGWTEGGRMVACTQPRRVAAMTVAARVAEEVGTELGQQVGYSIRFEEGVTRINVVMVDEAHERSLATDVLLGLLKKVQRQRPDLRVVISSATLQADKIAAFFDTATVKGKGLGAEGISKSPAVMSVEGRTHPVQQHYAQDPVSDYVQAAVTTAVSIHEQDLPGDILIFLTGQEECEAAVSMLEEEARRFRRAQGSSLRLMPVALYAGLPAASQLQAFEATPRGYRKVVAATNIAETSVTLEGVVYVIDSLFAKQQAYNPLTGLDSLLVAPISKASAAQRAGRAGRVRPGFCFRHCTEEAFLALPDSSVPEMQRCELAGTVLQLKAMGIDNVMKFDWLASPPAETMIRALELLHALGALGDDARLTNPVGLQMSELSVEPRLAKAILASAGELACSQEVVTIVAMLSVHSVWAGARGERKAQNEAKMRFAVGEGDLITFLNIWKGWEDAGRSRTWCYKNFINHRTMLRAADIRNQLQRHLRRLGLPWVSAVDDLMSMRKALAAGLFSNAAQYVSTTVESRDKGHTGVDMYHLVRSTGHEVKLKIGSQSVLWRTKPQWVLFFQVQQSSSGWYEMQDIVTIEADWLPELAPHMYQKRR